MKVSGVLNMTPQFKQLIARCSIIAKSNEEYSQMFVSKFKDNNGYQIEEDKGKFTNSYEDIRKAKRQNDKGSYCEYAILDKNSNLLKDQDTGMKKIIQDRFALGNECCKDTIQSLKINQNQNLWKKTRELSDFILRKGQLKQSQASMSQQKNKVKWYKPFMCSQQAACFGTSKITEKKEKISQEKGKQNVQHQEQQPKNQTNDKVTKSKEERDKALDEIIQQLIESGKRQDKQKENKNKSTAKKDQDIVSQSGKDQQTSNKNQQKEKEKSQGAKLSEFLDNELLTSYKKNMKKQVKQQKLYLLGDELLGNSNDVRKQGEENKGFKQFEQYWQLSDVEKGISESKLFKGVYVANEKNQHLGRVKCESLEGNVFINSNMDQNRALHNCVVAVQIIEGDPKKRIKKIDDKTEISVIKQELLREENQEEGEEEREEPQMSLINDDRQQDGQEIILTSDKPKNSEESSLIAKIVYIFENPYENDRILGYLQPRQDEKEAKRIEGKNQGEQGASVRRQTQAKLKYWFIPKQSKLPRMIPVEFTEEFNAYIEENSIDVATQYVVAKMKNWRADSFYAEVSVEECLGKRGDIEIECQALLEEFGVYNEDFTPATEEYLQKYRNQLDEKGEFIIPQEEKAKRWNLTNEIICSIDPEDAKDLDDALSVKEVREGVYEIGVHIADVSHFVQPNTPLDEDARLRTTSVYLVHKVIPMLPQLLCENLCSLNPNVERLAFTVFFFMNEKGEVLQNEGIRIGKSVINSASKFSYDTVQQMIEKKIKSYEELPEKNQPRNGIDGEKMFSSIMTLSRLGMARREQRINNGVFKVDSVKKRFKLNDKLWPIDYVLEDRKEANFIVEEFMLLANQLIGQAIVEQCSSLAVLRQHCFPSVEKQNSLNLIAQQFNKHKVDFTNLSTINESIDAIQNDPLVSIEQKIFMNRQMHLVLEQAQYFVAGSIPRDQWKHFALNFDIYTHFTSPIRRYPDLLVHRVMNEILNCEGKIQEPTDNIQTASLLEIMDLCNANKAKAKKVSDSCQKIFMCLYLKDHCVESQGMVVSFGHTSMTVFVPDYEIQTTLFFADYKDIRKTSVEKTKEGVNQLKLIFRTNSMPAQHTVFFTAYSPITISLTSTDTFPIDYKVKITLPDPFDKTLSHIIQ